MNNYFYRPEIKNLSQGARLEFVRNLRYMSKNNVADYFGFSGKNSTDSITKYENNDRSPSPGRLIELADLYDVSTNAIKQYDFRDPLDVIYFHMWEEEIFPYCEFTIDYDTYKDTNYNDEIVEALEEWQDMRDKRENGEITDKDYLEWKLHFEPKNMDK